MDIITGLRAQLNFVHQTFEKTMEDVTSEQAHWLPPGTAQPISSRYAHMVTAEDFFFQQLNLCD